MLQTSLVMVQMLTVLVGRLLLTIRLVCRMQILALVTVCSMVRVAMQLMFFIWLSVVLLQVLPSMVLLMTTN